MALHDLKWVCSYETLKLDTVDGDLHRDQYFIYKGKHYVRRHPNNNEQFTCLEDLREPHETPIDIQSEIQGKTLVNVIDGEHMYYDEFILPDNRRYRVPSTSKDYRDLAKHGARKREKKVTDREITDIKKEDSQWQ